MSLPFLYSTAINEPLSYTLPFSLFLDREKLKDTSFPYIRPTRKTTDAIFNILRFAYIKENCKFAYT